MAAAIIDLSLIRLPPTASLHFPPNSPSLSATLSLPAAPLPGLSACRSNSESRP